MIAANSQREKTAWDKLEEVRQMREIARRAKEHDGLPGRVRDLVAKSLHVSSSRIAKYDSILNNLLPELMVEIKADCLPISTAYELSTLESSEQLRQYAFFREHGKLPEKAAQSDVFHRNTQPVTNQPDEPAQPNVFHRNTQPVADQPDEPPQPDVFHRNTQLAADQPEKTTQSDVFHRNTQPVTDQPDEPPQPDVFHRNTQPQAAQPEKTTQSDVFHRNTQPDATQPYNPAQGDVFHWNTQPDEWSNDACYGYVIMAMENCGFANKDIQRVVKQLYEVFDISSVDDAKQKFHSSQY